MKRLISSDIAEEHAKGDSAPEPDAAQNAKDGAYLLSLVQSHAGSTTANVPPPATDTPKPPSVTLHSILNCDVTSGRKLRSTALSLEGRRSPNHHIYQIFSSLIEKKFDPNEESLTELDSHANMVVVSMQSYILNYAGRTDEVRLFTLSYDALKNVPIVDAIILYNCPFSGKIYLLVFHNSLFVSLMTHNLIPPFIFREANIFVNNVPKIYSPDLDETTHYIWFPDS